MDLVEEAGLDVSDWSNFKGGASKAASNPKYCYEWAFVQGELITLNMWFENIQELAPGEFTLYPNFRKRAQSSAKTPNQAIWKRRAAKADAALQLAYTQQLPLKIIICDGVRRTDDSPDAKPSSVSGRMLDTKLWAVTSYNFETGDCRLERGVTPVIPEEKIFIVDDCPEGLEGALRMRYLQHRTREKGLRSQKIKEALLRHNGSLLCETPNCGFDFFKVYGDIGKEYAEVHHKIPLSQAPVYGRKTLLEDLVIVCSNCHAMIHRGGECRQIEVLIPLKES